MTSFGSGFEAGGRADGRRAYTDEYDSEAETWTRTYYLYDGGNAVAELDTSGNLKFTNVFAPDGLVCRRSAAGTTGYYLFDQQGNASEMVVGGSVHVHSGYNAWGSVNHQYPIPTNSDSYLKFGFNARWGYVTDASTGLSYCQNRYYDPVTGRFLTRDPIGYKGGANLYGYCGGNPVLNADPWGLRLTALYMLVEQTTEELIKWGKTVTERYRYSKAELKAMNARMVVLLSEDGMIIKALERALIKLRPGDPAFQREFWAGWAGSFREGKILAKYLPIINEALESVGKDPISLGIIVGEIMANCANPELQRVQEAYAGNLDRISSDEPPVILPSLREKFPRWSPN